MYEKDPDELERLGYGNARPKLKPDAEPNLPLVIEYEEDAKQQQQPKQPRKAFLIRRRKEVIEEILSSCESEDAIPPKSEVLQCNAKKPKIPTHMSTSVQVGKPSIDNVSKRTRRIQVDIKPTCRSFGVQCNLLKPVENQEAEDIAQDYQDMEIDEDDVFEDDPEVDEEDFDSDSECDDEVESFTLHSDHINPAEEKYFLVSESSLSQLLNVCRSCCNPCQTTVRFTQGTMISTLSKCQAGHSWTWNSQSTHNHLPWGNLLLACAIFYSGSNASKVLRLFEILKLQCFTKRTFFRIQANYLIPSVKEVWGFEQARLFEERHEKEMVLGGDARCDSPGYSAKYGSYSLMDLSTQTILDVQLVQCNEVKGSTHMELEGLKRGLHRLQEEDLKYTSLVTDRHVMIKKFMKDQPETKHFFDVWHVAKGITKKLDALSKKKGGESIRLWMKSISSHLYWAALTSGEDEELKKAKWLSVLRHIINKHDGHSEVSPACLHGQLDDREWMTEGSRPYKMVCSVVNSPYLMRDIGKLSPLHQTYGLEVYHSVVNHFAPKSTHFFFDSMQSRLFIAAMHFNENGKKDQATTADGTPRWNLSFPKAQKGSKAVVKPVKNNSTFDYIQLLLRNVIQRRHDLPSYLAAAESRKDSNPNPPPLTSSFDTFDKDELIKQHKTRFSKT